MNTAAAVGLTVVDWIGNWPGARWLQQSGTAYLSVNATHILGLCLLLGAILPLDLRLVLGRAQAALPVLAPVAIRTAAVGLALALLTGAWLFSVSPADYLENTAMALVRAAGGGTRIAHGRTRIGGDFGVAVDCNAGRGALDRLRLTIPRMEAFNAPTAERPVR